MAENNLKELIAKMKAENSQTSSVNTKKKVKTDDEEMEEEYNEEQDNDEEQELEVPKPQGMKPTLRKVPKEVPQETEEVSLADQIRNLHDEGIYRLELLNVLHQINNNLRIVAGVLADYKK